MSERAPVSRDASSYLPPEGLTAASRPALLIGAAALVVSAIGGVLNPEQFFRSYLVAFLYWLSIPLGCFGIAMLHHLSRGAWGLMIRRVLEAATRTLPLNALFFVPLVFGLPAIYAWARPAEAAADPTFRHRALYLNVPFFILRAALYFALWILFARVLDRLSRRQDETADPRLSRRMQMVAAPGFALYCLAASFASIDWLMSLSAPWTSSIYGFYFVGGQAVSALAFVILVVRYLAQRLPMSGVLRPIHFHDYGKLLLTFVVLWAYFAVSQLIIIWHANLSEEVSWYRGRLLGGWAFVSLLLVALHFALPLLLLLSRDLKRNVARLSGVAALLLLMRFVDLYWQAAPAFSSDRVAPHWLDLAIPIALGGLWLALFLRELAKRPLLPVNDPFLPEALRHE